MRLWRLASARRARDFDGGYGLLHDGRWNTRGRPVTYCSTAPSLAALEKRVHVSDPALLPPMMMVEYEASEDLPARTLTRDELDADWASRQTYTQALGDAWLDRGGDVLMIVPSVILPWLDAPDRNVVINHRHAAAVAKIELVRAIPFTLDVRLF